MTMLLDCTIRDGGHLNGWNFERSFAINAFNKAKELKIDIFEAGYRYDNPKEEWGEFAYCEDDLLKELFNKEGKIKLSIMIDAGKCSSYRLQEKSKSPLDIVRIATHPNKLIEALKLFDEVNKKGYETILNLMAINEFSEAELKTVNPNKVKTIYFSDSYGKFKKEDIKKYYDKLTSLGFKNICFHGHNASGQAYNNSIEAISLGFYCVDGSQEGLGRNGGLASIESLLEFKNRDIK